MKARTGLHSFEPKLLSVLREGYGFSTFFADLQAGAITGLVALPLCIAFAVASGVPPQQGIATGIFAGFVISMLSGSRVQIGGPTGACVVVVGTVIHEFGYQGLATATLMAGLLLIVLGLSRMGNVIKYIPYPVTVGFTSGIAVIIGIMQVRDILGLRFENTPVGTLNILRACWQNLHSFQWPSLAIGLGTVVLIQGWPKKFRRYPIPLVLAVVLPATIVHMLDLPVETIRTRYGELSASLPEFRVPVLDFGYVVQLFPAALTIAMLAGIVSLLSAVVTDGMTGRRHRSNIELIAQGFANVISPLFGGIPATGAVARAMTNIRQGAKTPVSGMVHSLVLLLIFVFFGQLTTLIPMAALAGILLTIAINMCDYRLLRKMLHAPRGDLLVLLSTFGLTVFVNITVAIEVGFVLASILFMRRMEEVSGVRHVLPEHERAADDDSSFSHVDIHGPIPGGVEIYDIRGPFFFGATRKFIDNIHTEGHPPKVLILHMKEVPAMDATGLFALESICDRAVESGTRLMLAGVHHQPLQVLTESGLLDKLGKASLHKSLESALQEARKLPD